MAKTMQANFQCVIPCGGNSSRLKANTNKCLLQIGNKTILNYVIDFWKMNGVKDFIFIVGGHTANEVTKYAKSLCPDAVIINRGNIANLLKAVQLVEPHIEDKFILALGDCLNFGQFTTTYKPLAVGVCVTQSYELRKSYLVQVDSHSVTRLIEKPQARLFGLCGMGTMFLDKRIFHYIDRLSLRNEATSVDLTGALQLAIGEGEIVRPVFFKGDYINVTYPKDIATVELLARIYNNQQITGKVLCC